MDMTKEGGCRNSKLFSTYSHISLCFINIKARLTCFMHQHGCTIMQNVAKDLYLSEGGNGSIGLKITQIELYPRVQMNVPIKINSNQ